MEIVSTVESVAHAVAQAVEHPFHTIGARLKSAGDSLATFFGHPYCSPPLQEALTTVHGVVADLAQEVAELRRPCTDCPKLTPTASTIAGPGEVVYIDAAGGAGQALAAAGDAAPDAVTLAGDDLAEWRQFQAHKAAFEQFAKSLAGV